jgi:hypothetical protein
MPALLLLLLLSAAVAAPSPAAPPTAATTSAATCSCLSPAAVEGAGLLASNGVYINGTFFSAVDPSPDEFAVAANSAGGTAEAPTASGVQVADSLGAAPSWWKASHDGICNSLSTASAGGQCGADIAVCPAVSVCRPCLLILHTQLC